MRFILSSGRASVPQPQLVCPWILRLRFNAEGYVERAARTELLVDVIFSRPPAPASNEPPGTLSQRIRYSTLQGQVLVVAHQFLRPDGTIGGHGETDPKIMWTHQGRLDIAHNDTVTCS